MGQKVNPHGLRVGVIKDWGLKMVCRENFADCSGFFCKINNPYGSVRLETLQEALCKLRHRAEDDRRRRVQRWITLQQQEHLLNQKFTLGLCVIPAMTSHSDKVRSDTSFPNPGADAIRSIGISRFLAENSRSRMPGSIPERVWGITEA